MLKMIGVQLELLRDVNILLIVERGIRGGLACAMKRYARYLSETYDPSKSDTYLTSTCWTCYGAVSVIRRIQVDEP